MSELTDEEYEKYNDEIVAARTRIVESIKDIIKSYGEFAETPSSMSNAKTNAYWFPIGGSEITEEDGKKFAIGEPVSTNIRSLMKLMKPFYRKDCSKIVLLILFSLLCFPVLSFYTYLYSYQIYL